MGDVDLRDGNALDEQLTSDLEENRGRLLVDYYRRFAQTGPVEWIWDLSDRFERHGLPLPVIRSVTADLAWAARRADQPYPDEDTWKAASTGPSSRMRRMVLAYVLGQRLRFDFKLVQLQSWSRRWVSLFDDDALLLGFAAFAELGLKAPEGLELFKRSTRSANADSRSRHVCLAAIWFSHHIEDQPKILLELSDEMISKGEVNNDVYYRRALAFRKLGRFDDALQAVDQAMAIRPVEDVEVYQNYARERELIWATAEIHQQVQSMTSEIRDRLAAQLEERVDAARRTMEDSLVRIIEILGLFIAIIGFLLGVGAVVLKADTFQEIALAVALALVGSVSFFGLLRVVMSVHRR